MKLKKSIQIILLRIDGKVRSYDNFCQEALFDRFNYFARYLWHYPERSESGYAHQRLAKQGVPPNDSR
jgi:hypothetical protein